MFLRYHEVCDYNFHDSKSNSGKVTGHFTQLVWKPTREFGTGYAMGVDKRHPDVKCVYVVARYKPAGNILGRFSSNVGGHASVKDNICSSKVDTQVSEPNQDVKAKQLGDMENHNEDISSKVFPEQKVTKLHQDHDGMSEQSEDGTRISQEPSLIAPSTITEMYGTHGENMGTPADVTDELPTMLEEESTSIAKTAKLYETNGNNVDVPSAKEISEALTDDAELSKQQTSEVQSSMDSDMSLDTTPSSMVPSNADGVGVPSQQEPSFTPPEISSQVDPQGMSSAEDTAAVKTPLATGTSQAVPNTVAAPSQPVANVVAPVTSGKAPTSSSPMVAASSPVGALAKPATSVKPVKEECKNCLVSLTMKLL